jgi:RNA binding exosome subunit
MKYAHLIKLTVFSYEDEDKDSIFDSLLGFFPFNLESNEISVKKTKAEGFNENKVEILNVMLAKTNLINQFLKGLLEKMDEGQKRTIFNQAESRLDKNLDFFMRFDKGEWINEKKLALTDSGKCFHMKISIAAFPKKRELALKVIKDLSS